MQKFSAILELKNVGNSRGFIVPKALLKSIDENRPIRVIVEQEDAPIKTSDHRQANEAPVVNHRYTAHQPSVYDVAPTIEVWRGEILMPRLLSG